MPRKTMSTQNTPARKSSGDDARRATTIRFTTTRFNSSAFCENANPDEDWTKIPDLAERRRIQNRIAQRNYRKKLKQRLEEGQQSDSDSVSTKSPSPPFGTLSRRQSPSYREVPRSQPAVQMPHQRAASSSSSIFSEQDFSFGTPLSYSPPSLIPDDGSDSPFTNYGSFTLDDFHLTSEPMQMPATQQMPQQQQQQQQQQQPMFTNNDFTDFNPFDSNFTFEQDNSWSMPMQPQQSSLDAMSPFAFEQTPPLSPSMYGKQPLKAEADPMLCFSLEPQNMMSF